MSIDGPVAPGDLLWAARLEVRLHEVPTPADGVPRCSDCGPDGCPRLDGARQVILQAARCQVRRDGMRCALRPGHSEDPPGKHWDEVFGNWAVDGSPAAAWLAEVRSTAPSPSLTVSRRGSGRAGPS